MQHKLQTFWPFLWLLCLWLYVVTPISLGTGVDLGKRSGAQSPLPFTLLLLLHAALYILGHFHLLPRRWHWLYIIIQGGLVFAMSLVVLPANTLLVSGALFLALIAEAVSIWHQREPVTLTVLGAVLFFLLNIVLRGGWTAFHPVLLYLVPVLLVASGYIIFYFRLARAHEQTRLLLTELAAAHRKLATYAASVEDLTLANERQRLARELHDTLAQGLVGLTLQLDTADALLTEQSYDEAQEIVQQAMSRARFTLAAARCAIDDLRAQASEHLSLFDAVQAEIRRFTTATGLVCHTHNLPTLTSLPPSSQEHLLRIVSESLMNIARHARAHQAWLCLEPHNGALVLIIRDDGAGFDPDEAAMSRGHYGLLGLRERARLLGGRLEIQSAPGAGTTLRISFPENETAQPPVETMARSVVSAMQGVLS